jgi:hypothetical protein
MRGKKLKPMFIIVRWIARIWSLLSIIVLSLPTIIDGPYWMQVSTLREIVGHICFLGIFLGLILAWRWELLGASMIISSLLVFYIVMFITGRLPIGLYLILISFPGLLFLMSWFYTHYKKQEEKS